MAGIPVRCGVLNRIDLCGVRGSISERHSGCGSHRVHNCVHSLSLWIIAVDGQTGTVTLKEIRFIE